MLPIAASILIGLGVALLYAAWSSSLPRGAHISGWFSILLGTTAWTEATGNDRGVAIALIILCISAMGVVGVSAVRALFSYRRMPQASPGRGRRAGKRSAGKGAPSRRVGERIAWTLLAGPGAAILAFTVALSSHQLMLRADAAPANALVTELFLFPVLWGVIAVWSLMTKNLWRHSGRLLICQIIAGVLLIITGS